VLEGEAMRKGLVKMLCSLIAAVMILPLFPVAAAEQPPEIDSSAGVVYNLEKEEILFEKNLDIRLSPAAFTKLMTALLAYEYRSEKGNFNVTVTEEMLSSASGTSMKLKPGEVISLDHLLLGLVVANANDAALVIASAVGGSVTAFVEKMNLRAKELGMTQTYYANPTGIDSVLMYTTLRDTLLLCRALYRVNDYMLASELPQAVISATNLTPERVYTNKNALIPFSYVTDYYLEGVRGMIAGYTGNAGYCVATVRRSGNCTNLVVLSGGVDRSEKKNGLDISSYRDAKALLEWAEESFSIRTVLEKGKILCEKKVRLSGKVDHVILIAKEELSLLLPKDIDLQTQVQIVPVSEKEVLTAPIIEGDSYGVVEVYYQGVLVGSVSLVAQSDVTLSRWLVMWDAVQGFFSQGAARAVLILAGVVAVLYVLILIFTVWLQYARRNRARKLAMDEINREENRRLRQVRLNEKEANRERLRRAGTFLRAGYQVLSGEAEVIRDPTEKKKRKRKKSPGKAVAKVPERYRKENRRAVAEGKPAFGGNGKNPSAEKERGQKRYQKKYPGEKNKK